MTAPEFEARIVEWARLRPDLEALVQIGSRVQPGATVDAWSDWDYHLIVRRPAGYFNRDWPAQIAPCWSVHFERTERAVVKLSAVFAGGWEVDFVPLAAWQVKLAYAAMRHPGAQGWFPPALRRGIHNLRLIARPGARVILGGPAWERRLTALAVEWPAKDFSAADFQDHTAAFWRHAVWVGKKTLRGELRAALRWHHTELQEHIYALLEEEARLAGRAPRPEARQAEQWLDDARLRQTAITTGPEQRVLARALLAELTLFREVSQNVAKQPGFTLPDYSAVEAWLRAELGKVSGG
ncbi:MAG TPA: hypothetical protein VKC51_11250 [Lacunisphaera sp.]|nr:hypothetical protein [Lacunisphaera sp.]